MEAKEYIESGILELYVYGLLSETENEEVNAMAKNNPEINDEIIAIEKAIVALSSSFSPFHSVANYEKIKSKLELKHAKVIELEPTRNWSQYIGWAAAILLLAGIGYQYNQLEQTNTQVVNAEVVKAKMEKDLNALELKNKASETNLAVVRDANNTVVALGGQAVAPQSSAKVYWNKETKVVYVDATGLPEPPEGMVYQVWSLKLNPLTPTSIGLLDNFKLNDQKMFAVDNATDAEAFGITLEPKGGSLTPTMEQLYTLGKV
ncbi:anti-sigma factor [Flavobacterium gawalongense]|uniref:Anti-sigma factor n=1 Tax=Flavobacterium gawalongense TaxID=2594432 RepID=A0A553BBC4_9FLAO|nr:anti-sigma factor [Flavobacterium gawalongense]TRW97190.1 anti-sigma factor [Flavobacterium gawalongense]TRX02145.1 anti-sigma factor [Flavobacterium gawalongense]TRX05555.1 anti-sigma factor [Flavobacterium gawalongense]TRX06362.1 anti-sigma factor [Flavobacterium gawalongense]TRX21995.1 anti-sigma factor [Flavobacterium gawalongense]